MNIFETQVETEKPQGVLSQSKIVYIPIVTSTMAGIAKFDTDTDFIISQGKVFLSKLNEVIDSEKLVKSSAVKSYVDTVDANRKLYIDNNFVTKSVYNSKVTSIENRLDTAEDTITLQGTAINTLDITKANKSYVNDTFVTKTTYNTDINATTIGLKARMTSAEDIITILNSKINAIQGKGGYLLPHNFGTSTPTEESLTEYALSQISNISEATEIFDGTKVTNSYDNHTWILNNTPDTNPAVFEWVDLGFEYTAVATNSQLGIVKGIEYDSTNPNTLYRISIDTNGEMVVNNLLTKLNSIDTLISSLDTDINDISTGLKTRMTSAESSISVIRNDYVGKTGTQFISAQFTFQQALDNQSNDYIAIRSDRTGGGPRIHGHVDSGFNGVHQALDLALNNLVNIGLSLSATINSAAHSTYYRVNGITNKINNNYYYYSYPSKSGTFAMTNDLSNFVTMTQIESILAGYERARAFDTLSSMNAWLSDADNKGLLKVGDELLIVATDTPDYWVTEVLQTADPLTGYYYKISELETKQIDLTNYASKTYVDTAISQAILDSWEGSY